MIEREDIENSYNMLIGAESSSEGEEITQHLETMKQSKAGVKLFCSP